MAAARAPARPEPTTITEYFRLFAGLTSFMSNLCFVHFCSIGPAGTFDFSSTARAPGYLMTPAKTARGIAAKPSHDENGQHRGQLAAEVQPFGLAHAERLEQTPDAVPQVEAQRQHRQQVKHRDRREAQAADEVGVDVPFLEARKHRAGREVKDVVDDEHRQQRAGQSH